MGYFPPKTKFIQLGKESNLEHGGSFNIFNKDDPEYYENNHYYCSISQNPKTHKYIAQVWKWKTSKGKEFRKKSKPFITKEEAAEWLDSLYIKLATEVFLNKKADLHNEIDRMIEKLESVGYYGGRV